jgi:PIN domain nuclease of toxin-antitoxin system
MLIAQAMIENLHLVSIERAFDAYGVLRLWRAGAGPMPP